MKKRNFMKAKNSFLGRVLRRLLGEENGAVMMEYIVVGLLIAAACVVAVAFFGHQITGMFGSLSYSVAGDPGRASEQQNTLIQQTETNITNAQSHNTGKHDGNPVGDQAFSDGN